MENQINLYWYKHEKGKGNFGDELNHFIVNKLSGKQVRHVDILKLPNNGTIALKQIICKILRGDLKINNLFKSEEWMFLSKQKVIVGIGSVISWYNYPYITVWGAGIMTKNASIKKANFTAVRGKYTLQKIMDSGYDADGVVIGDPALLLPLIVKKQAINKKNKIGLIPHYLHYESIQKSLPNESFLVINLLDSIEHVIEQIHSCEFTLSTSLHGLIVSHAYRVPSLWVDFINLEDRKLSGDNVKFKDYFSSVGIGNYDAVALKSDFSDDDLKKLRIKYSDRILPDAQVVNKIQKDLLQKAPFDLKEEFTI